MKPPSMAVTLAFCAGLIAGAAFVKVVYEARIEALKTDAPVIRPAVSCWRAEVPERCKVVI